MYVQYYYLSFKKGNPAYTTIWMNFENMLGEMPVTQRQYMIPPI